MKNEFREGMMNPEEDARAKREESKKTVLLYLHDFVYWLTGILLVFLLLFRVVVVSGPSMNQTLVHGDYLLLINEKEAAEAIAAISGTTVYCT